MKINPGYKLARLVNLNYHVLPVLNRFGLCTGFGNKTVGQFCEENNINLDFFVEIINAFLDKNYIPDLSRASYKVTDLVNYLTKAHKFYRHKLQFIEYLLKIVIDNCCRTEKTKVELIFNFFAEYKSELLQHFDYEDKELYPYIVEIEEAVLNKKQLKNTEFQGLDHYHNDHLNVGDKIVDFKTIILKYLPVHEPTEECNQLIFNLYDFEYDLFNHQSIEERILIPRAIEYQKILNSKNG